MVNYAKKISEKELPERQTGVSGEQRK